MDDSMTTRASLVLRLRDPRDERAWQEFTVIYGPFVTRLARRKGLQDADASDLVQEVFQSVAAAVERGVYDASKGSFRGWLFTIARNKMLNFLALGRKTPRGSGDTDLQELLESLPSPENSSLFEEEYRRRLFDWAAERVKKDSTAAAWQAFTMTGMEGKSAAVVAEALGTTTGTVYYHKSQIMARLRRLIETVTEDGPEDRPGGEQP